MFLCNWLRPRRPYTVSRRLRRAGRFIRPQLELLEDRLTPANFTAGNADQLAAAIIAADNTQSTITLTASFSLDSDLTIGNTSGLTIDGAGNTLTAATNSGLFIVSSGANATFQNVTLTGGNATRSISTISYLGGGAIEDLGGNVTLSGAKVTNNKISGGVSDPAAHGGGVFVSNGTLTIRNSSFSKNVGQGENGNAAPRETGNGPSGGTAQGGGLYGLNSTITIVNSSFASNSALGGPGGTGGTGGGFSGGGGGNAQGGGLYSAGGSLQVSNTTFSANIAKGGIGGKGGKGGGDAPSGGNGANGGTAQGGGVCGSNSTITIVNSSFVGNSAPGGNGGAGGNGETSFSGAKGGAGGSGGDGQGGGLYSAAGALPVINTTFSANTAQGGNGGNGGNGFNGSAALGPGGNGGNGGNGDGGGVFDSASSANSYLNNTLAFNKAAAGSGGNAGTPPPATAGSSGRASGGGIFVNETAPTFVNNLLQANTAITSGPDYSGGVDAAASNNFVSNASGAVIFNPANNILNNSTNQLGPLTTAANGTSYYPLLPGVVSINGGSNSVLPTIANAEGVPVAEATDQIGNPRVDPVSHLIDIGAIEFPTELTTVSVTPVNTTFSCMSHQITLTAQVTDGELTVDEGTVTFTVASGTGTVIGTVANVAVVNGQASTPFTIPANTPVGTYTITASYSDPSNPIAETGGRFGSSSGTGPLTIASAPTTVTPGNATARFSPSPQTARVTVAVSSPDCPAVDEGTVTVKLNGNTIGTGTVSNGSANVVLTIPAGLPVGTYTLVENYTDSAGNFTGSSSGGTLTIVSAGPVAVTVADPEVGFPNVDPTITLAATLTVNGTAVTEGQVQFTVVGLSSQPITVPVVNGQASVPFEVAANTPVGTYTVAASYSDSAGNYQNGAGASTLTVQPSASTVTINNVGIVYNLFSEQVTLSAVARDPNGVTINEGFVTFTDAGQTATAPIVNGLATVTLTIPLLAENPFAHAITVAYGDNTGNLLASTSQFMLEQTILDFLLQIMALEMFLQSSSGSP